MPKKQKDPSFEEALSELETLVETLEKGNLPLDESLKSFERGVALTRQCQASLEFAEQKVRILSDDKADGDLEPFDEHED